MLCRFHRLHFLAGKQNGTLLISGRLLFFPEEVFSGAIPAPADQFDSIPGLLIHLKKHYPSVPIHLIDADGSIATAALASYDMDWLDGGYNAFKHWRDNIYVGGPAIAVVTGKTGCGKTEFLRTLAKNGRQVMDLELLANHRGSVFGALTTDQPAVEQFQFDLLESWLSLNPDLPVWIEVHSRPFDPSQKALSFRAHTSH